METLKYGKFPFARDSKLFWSIIFTLWESLHIALRLASQHLILLAILPRTGEQWKHL